MTAQLMQVMVRSKYAPLCIEWSCTRWQSQTKAQPRKVLVDVVLKAGAHGVEPIAFGNANLMGGQPEKVLLQSAQSV